MESFDLLFERCRPGAGRSPGLLVGLLLLLLLTRHGWAQVYTGGYSSTSFSYYDVTTGKLTGKAATPAAQILYMTVFQGKIYAVRSGKIYIYDPGTNKWSTVVNTDVTPQDCILGVGNYIYRSGGDATRLTELSRYDVATNTFTPLASTNVGYGNLAYDGGDYIYMGSRLYNTLIRYSISGNKWSALLPATHYTYGIAFKNGKVYLSAPNSANFSVYDPATDSYTTLAAPPGGLSSLVSGDGNYLYGSNVNLLARYDISTNTWTKLSAWGDISLVYMGTSCAPTATATATQATCATGGGANANAALTLSTYGGGATKVGYSAGSSYTGPDYASATGLTTAPMTLTSTLANPVSDQPYTIRVFKDAACYQDVLVTLSPKVCLMADLSLTGSPPTQSGAKGEQLSYTFTLTNAGPDAAPDVTVDIPIPNNTQFLSARASQGSYSAGTAVWTVGTVPVGSQTITLTLQLK